MVSDGNAIYFGSGGALTKVAFSDKTVTTLAEFHDNEGPWGSSSVAVDEKQVYFCASTSGYVVGRIAKGGGQVETVLAPPEPGFIAASVTVDEQAVYVAHQNGDGSGDVFRFDTATLEPTIWPSPSVPVASLADAHAFYWGDAGGVLHKHSKVDGTETIAQTARSGYPLYLAQDAAYLYAYDPSLGLRRIAKDTGTTSAIAVDQGNNLSEARELAVDETYVYWSTVSEKVFRVPIAGGAVERLAEPAQPVPFEKEGLGGYGLVIHEGYIYWYAYSEGAIRRVAR